MSHCELVRNHIDKYGSITPIEALNHYGCFRLSARIEDLRRNGENIVTQMVKSNKKRFARYVKVESW